MSGRKRTNRKSFPKKRTYSQKRDRQYSLPKPLKGMDTVLNYEDVISTTTSNDFADVLNLVRAGTGSFNRVGKRIVPRSLRVKGVASYSIQPNATTGLMDSAILRIVIVHDKQPSSSTAMPTFNTIFGYTTQDGTESQVFYSDVRYDNTDRFRVLRDKYIEFQPNAIGDKIVATAPEGAVVVRKYIDEYIKLPNDPVVYSSTAEPMTISNISTGAYYLYARVTTPNLSIDSHMGLSSVVRFRYSD